MIEKIANEIFGNCYPGELARAKEIKDDNGRCGMIGEIFRSAMMKTNICRYKSVPHWWSPDDHYWKRVDEDDLKAACREAIKMSDLQKSDIFKREKRIIEMMLDNVIFNRVEPRKEIICFANCVLDVDSMVTYPHSPKYPCFYALGYNYREGAGCGRWISFLEEVLPDLKSRMVLQEYLGCIFINRKKVTLEKMLYLLGGGSNGKSVVFKTISGIIGDGNMSTYDLAKLAGKAESSSYSIADMDGKLLNYCSDVDKKQINDGVLKPIISGEPVMARLPYQKPFKTNNLPIMMANANALPPTSDYSEGYYRRMMVMRFDVKITEDRQDHKLPQKLESEYSGIFNWVMEGRKRFTDSGYKFTKAPRLDMALQQYRVEDNAALSYMRTVGYNPKPTYIGQARRVGYATDVYSDFRLWCDKAGLRPFCDREFSRHLQSAGYNKGRVGNRMAYDYYESMSIREYVKLAEAGQGTLSEEEYMSIAKDSEGLTPEEIKEKLAARANEEKKAAEEFDKKVERDLFAKVEEEEDGNEEEVEAPDF